MPGPFQHHAIHRGQVSRFAVNLSINDDIPKRLCSLQYVAIDDAISHFVKLGQGTLLAKAEIISVFRLLLIHLASRHLLQMTRKGYVYLDTCLPFGLR